MTQPEEVAGRTLIGPLDISDEEWREYEWQVEGWNTAVVRIDNPVSLYYREGGSTHRVVDGEGITHCVPSVGVMGCELRWFNPCNPVSF